jgi:NhaA family Na+:H+ antiporter
VAGIALVLALRAVGARSPFAYLLPGAVVWAGLLRAGVHPTLAGVALGLRTPARPWHGREALPPVSRLTAALHPWVAYGVMPLFALANAGVDLRGTRLGDPAVSRIALGVIVGLVAGKPIGVLGASYLAERMGLAARPEGVSWRGVALVGLTAGIGFTMAIFIAGLAFTDPGELGAAKLAGLAASSVSGMLALAAGRALFTIVRG